MWLEVGSQLAVEALHVEQLGVAFPVDGRDLVDQCADPRKFGPQVAVVDGVAVFDQI